MGGVPSHPKKQEESEECWQEENEKSNENITNINKCEDLGIKIENKPPVCYNRKIEKP